MNITLAHTLQKDSIVDGEGLRTVIWTQGCPHHCYGCHNPDTHSFDGGITVNVDDIKRELSTLKEQTGITFSGGDPMCQVEPCIMIAKYAHTLKLDVWCYTGYTYDQILEMSQTNPLYLDFLNQIDVLVDGPFMIKQKSLNLKFRGSSNQRVINVKRSLKENKICLIKKYHLINNSQSLYKPIKNIYT